MIISPQHGDAPGRAVRARLVIPDWPAERLAGEVAPLHVHDADDEAWHAASGALRIRFAAEEIIAGAGRGWSDRPAR